MAFKKQNRIQIFSTLFRNSKFAFFLIILLGSYQSYSQTSMDYNSAYDELRLLAKETENEVFVITPDLVKHSGTKLSFQPKYFATSKFIKVDDDKYDRKQRKDIIAWQGEKSYNVYFGSRHYDATRYVKGKLNLYGYTSQDNLGGRFLTPNVHFLFEKSTDRFKFIDASFVNVETLFADNADVIKKYHELYPESVRKKSVSPYFNKYEDETRWIENIILLTQMYNKQSGK